MLECTQSEQKEIDDLLDQQASIRNLVIELARRLERVDIELHGQHPIEEQMNKEAEPLSSKGDSLRENNAEILEFLREADSALSRIERLA